MIATPLNADAGLLVLTVGIGAGAVRPHRQGLRRLLKMTNRT